MARSARNHRLAALLAEADWSGAELARAVNTLGAAQGLALRYDRTAIAHWLTGSRPRPAIAELVAQAFTRRCERLVTAADTGLVQAPYAAASPAAPGQHGQDAAQRLTGLCRADVDPAQRPAVVRSLYSPGIPPGLGTFEPAPMPASRLHRRDRPYTAADVEILHSMASTFADLTERYGGAHARSSLSAYLADDISRLLMARASSPEVRRELFAGAAQLTHLLARMSCDAGHVGLAQRYYGVALGLTREAHDARLYAVTLRAMSVQAQSLGYHRRADHLADAAVTVAGPDADPATRSFLLSQRALTHARMHRRSAAVADLIAAEEQHDRANTTCGGPFTHYPRAGLDYQRAQTFLALGDFSQATRALSAAAQGRCESQRRANALTHARLAETLLHTGQLEASCVHWHTLMDHYPYLRSVPVARAFSHMRRLLRPHQHQRHVAAVLRRARALRSPSPG
ncbi:tol-pal system YbgF family protein [Streptomyces sp. NPDC093595]|uniref:tetratricopeptide repeat protein n=1 Tax=Streptomyces sp. NPDC093595 TaxID=3366045 RepID=UPI00380A304D